MSIVKLYGCRYSGTKYLTSLLELNWDVVVATDEYGHKHGTPENVPSDLMVIVISKHPAAYIASVRDRYWGSKAPTQDLIDDWVKCHNTWLELTDKQGIAIKYDDLLFDFNSTMEKISGILKMRPQTKKHRNITKYCGNPRRVVKTKYYKNKEYMNLMTPDDQKALSTIPSKLLKKLGYQRNYENE